MTDHIRVDKDEWSRMLAIRNAAECWVEAAEISASLPFRGLMFGYDASAEAQAFTEYNKSLTKLFQAVRGVQVENAEPITASLAATIRSVPGLSDDVRSMLLKGLTEEHSDG